MGVSEDFSRVIHGSHKKKYGGTTWEPFKKTRTVKAMLAATWKQAKKSEQVASYERQVEWEN